MSTMHFPDLSRAKTVLARFNTGEMVSPEELVYYLRGVIEADDLIKRINSSEVSSFADVGMTKNEVVKMFEQAIEKIAQKKAARKHK